ncbi:hypothetical protein CYMTET_40422 [Cymbomonas tetramitiformis]|uniref:Uncharacterized protein n=1 Tax=Cymbomonas tetramitiformis TaxID=36881 RepID=A0AAE0C9W9_9CHLO|nr:hypothetical protein CYMTET_40422 [Cymbomonas tetramitiformis]
MQKRNFASKYSRKPKEAVVPDLKELCDHAVKDETAKGNAIVEGLQRMHWTNLQSTRFERHKGKVDVPSLKSLCCNLIPDLEERREATIAGKEALRRRLEAKKWKQRQLELAHIDTRPNLSKARHREYMCRRKRMADKSNKRITTIEEQLHERRNYQAQARDERCVKVEVARHERLRQAKVKESELSEERRLAYLETLREGSRRHAEQRAASLRRLQAARVWRSSNFKEVLNEAEKANIERLADSMVRMREGRALAVLKKLLNMHIYRWRYLFKKKLNCILVTQAKWRLYKYRARWRMYGAAVKRVYEHWRYRAWRHTGIKAAVVIQHVWRRHFARKMRRIRFTKLILRIQRAWRRHLEQARKRARIKQYMLRWMALTLAKSFYSYKESVERMRYQRAVLNKSLKVMQGHTLMCAFNSWTEWLVHRHAIMERLRIGMKRYFKFQQSKALHKWDENTWFARRCKKKLRLFAETWKGMHKATYFYSWSDLAALSSMERKAAVLREKGAPSSYLAMLYSRGRCPCRQGSNAEAPRCMFCNLDETAHQVLGPMIIAREAERLVQEAKAAAALQQRREYIFRQVHYDQMFNQVSTIKHSTTDDNMVSKRHSVVPNATALTSELSEVDSTIDHSDELSHQGYQTRDRPRVHFGDHLPPSTSQIAVDTTATQHSAFARDTKKSGRPMPPTAGRGNAAPSPRERISEQRQRQSGAPG